MHDAKEILKPLYYLKVKILANVMSDEAVEKN